MMDTNVEIEMNKLEVFNNEDYITDSYVAILRNRYNHQLLVQQQSVEELKSILPLLETSKDSSIVEQIKHVISTLEVTSNDKQIVSPSKHGHELSPVSASLYHTASSPQTTTTIESVDDSFYFNELDSLRMENIKLKVDVSNYEKALNQRNNVAKQVLQLSVTEADEMNKLAGELKVAKQQYSELSKRFASLEANLVREVESRVNYYRKITSMNQPKSLLSQQQPGNLNKESVHSASFSPVASQPPKGEASHAASKKCDHTNYENIIKNYKIRENELILALEAVVHRCQHLERQRDNQVVFR